MLSSMPFGTRPARAVVTRANARLERLGPISVGNKGRRADRPLSAQPEVVERMKRFNLCHWLFLRGECRGCQRNHHHQTLSDVEFDALWHTARQGRCYKSKRSA